MPTLEAMAQLSRPYQIGLGVVALLALVWVVALRGHASNPSEPAPSAAHGNSQATHASSGSSGGGSSTGASKAAEEARVAGTPTKIYHGPAPGVEGLTRDIAKAHEAVGASQREAKRFESAEAQDGPSGGGEASAARPSAAQTSPARTGPVSAPSHTSSAPARSKAGGIPTSGRPAQQVAVERSLAQHKTVVIVFWNPRSSVDARVRDEANSLAGSSKGAIMVYDAQPSQVGLFGPVTEVSHVYQTPTVLIVNGHGLISTLTGLTDTFALQQAVREAQRAK